ncbi:MAG: hypothetical protein RIC24_14555 [Hyphomicrobiales bacterium]
MARILLRSTRLTLHMIVGLFAIAFPTHLKDAVASETDELTAAVILLREHGLEGLLVRMAAEGQAPRRLDDITLLNSIEASGTVLRYEYSIDTQETSIGEETVTHWYERQCSVEATIPVIAAGAVIRSIFYNSNAKLMGTISVDAEVCGF